MDGIVAVHKKGVKVQKDFHPLIAYIIGYSRRFVNRNFILLLEVFYQESPEMLA